MGKSGKKKSQFKRRISEIDGQHPLRNAVPESYIDYCAKTRHGGEVFYFNFPLAEEMGLLEKGQPYNLTKSLEREILNTFSLQIINEYDIINKTRVAKKDIRPNKYMATRYLQLQHPGRTGKTSGDGRSIWNGYFKGKNCTWDISSCGTGTTRLCPATATENVYIKTGDPEACYGSGLSDLSEGLSAALMSDILHHNGIRTERTLAIIGFKDGSSINVRAYPNLIRPAHIFMYAKQNNLNALKRIVDYYIERQIKNKSWPDITKLSNKYQKMLEYIAIDFATMSAVFESEYIFCWMDWDGDNILGDGGIIDYGSLRQFGLFHHEYRYDDVDRYSTTITEQKNKARYIIQTFAQISDFIITGKKKNIRLLRNHRIFKLFNDTFDEKKDQLLLNKIGFNRNEQGRLLENNKTRMAIRHFRKLFSYFEKAKSRQGRYEITDGITWDAIFCMRDILRELPTLCLEQQQPISAEDFIEIIRSDYAKDEDLQLTGYRKSKIREFQCSYRNLIDLASKVLDKKTGRLLANLHKRSALINRYERITGDAIIDIANRLITFRKKNTLKQFYTMFNAFVDEQTLQPEFLNRHQQANPVKDKQNKKLLHNLKDIVKEYREGI